MKRIRWVLLILVICGIAAVGVFGAIRRSDMKQMENIYVLKSGDGVLYQYNQGKRLFSLLGVLLSVVFVLIVLFLGAETIRDHAAKQMYPAG